VFLAAREPDAPVAMDKREPNGCLVHTFSPPCD
jgi:hypothetical protein